MEKAGRIGTILFLLGLVTLSGLASAKRLTNREIEIEKFNIAGSGSYKMVGLIEDIDHERDGEENLLCLRLRSLKSDAITDEICGELKHDAYVNVLGYEKEVEISVDRASMEILSLKVQENKKLILIGTTTGNYRNWNGATEYEVRLQTENETEVTRWYTNGDIVRVKPDMRVIVDELGTMWNLK